MRQQYNIKRIVEVLGLRHEGEVCSTLWLSERIRQGFPADSLVRAHQDVLGGNTEHLRPVASGSALSRVRRGSGPLSLSLIHI